MKNRKVSFPVAASLTLAFVLGAYSLAGCSGTEVPPAPGDDTAGTGGVSTGGVSTGGVSTGGISTGGVSTGGVSTGGVSTGGVSTGGVSTGGVGVTGGSGGAGVTGGSAGDGVTGGSGGAGPMGGSGGAGPMGGSGGAGPMGGSGGKGGTAGAMGTGGAAGGSGMDNLTSGMDTMGWIGCSMGENVAIGYRRIGGNRMWGSNGNGGAVVQQWTDNNSAAWQRFDRKKGNATLAAVWIMICIFTSGATDAEVDSLVRNARSHAPGAYIYITGQPTYEPGYTCSLAGPGGPELTDELAQKAAMRHADVHYAGILGPLNANERADVCHANSTGEDKMGRQVKAIWGQP